MKTQTHKIIYDWSDTSLRDALDLMKERRIAVKKLELDGDNKKLILYVRYLDSVKTIFKRGEELAHGTVEMINLETGLPVYTYEDNGKTGVWKSFFDYIENERMLAEEENS